MNATSRGKGFSPQKKAAPLQLAGKTISAKNANSLISAKDAIGAGLATLSEILDSAGLTQEESIAASSDWQDSGLIACGNWEDYMRRSFWYSKLESVLSVFSYCFEGALHYQSIGEVDEFFGTPDELKESLMMFLQELQDSYESALSASTAIQAARVTEDLELMTFTVPSLTLLQSAKKLNSLPIEGMLFQCDTVSEGVPAVGPGKRLMIPRSVALAVVDQVQLLPLDADPTLRKHCNDSIVGGMLSAQLKDDNGFWIRGSLFPWSQPKIVAEIRASKRDMGFSINAYTRGHDEEIDGETVHVIDELTLVGANILYADSATFSSTKLVTAAKTDESKSSSIEIKPTVLIAANTTKDDSVMEELLKKLGAQVESQATALAALSETQTALTQGLQILLSDREAAQKTQAAAALIEEKKQSEEALATRILGMLNPQVSASNRSHQPARIVPAVLQSSAVQNPIETQIGLLNAELTGLQSSGSFSSDVMLKRVKLTDEISALKSQLTSI